jgi:hypothetical protein
MSKREIYVYPAEEPKMTKDHNGLPGMDFGSNIYIDRETEVYDVDGIKLTATQAKWLAYVYNAYQKDKDKR